jgi:putative Mg2+ transporter-C (MgtC) family protein
MDAIVAGWLHTLFVLAAAFVLGTAIGLERQWRQRSAGLRTTALVTIGAAAFTALGMRLLGMDGATRIIAYVVSGIGFLGAGVILKDGASIRGLNTAATLWCSASVGAFAGAGLFGEATAVTVFVLAANTLLRPLVNWVDRLPWRAGSTEAQYRVHASCARTDVADLRDLLDEVLTRAAYPIRDIAVVSSSENEVELAATLVPTTADPAELDAVEVELEASPIVHSATWSVGVIS